MVDKPLATKSWEDVLATLVWFGRFVWADAVVAEQLGESWMGGGEREWGARVGDKGGSDDVRWFFAHIMTLLFCTDMILTITLL